LPAPERMLTESSSNHTMLKGPKNLFGRRVAALVIDLIILGIIGYILSLFGKGVFVELGTHGVVVGWLISTIYYTIFNSHIGKGKSPGKRAMHLEVVNRNGSQLTIKEGLMRSLLFTTPFFLFDYIQNLFYSPIVSGVFGALNVAYYVGLFYFFVANADRRTVHDLIAHTIVKFQHKEYAELAPISKLKIYTYAGIIIAILGGFVALYFSFKDTANALSEVVAANQEVLGELATEIYDLDQVVRIESSKINVTVESEVGIVIEAWVNEDVNKEEARIIYKNIMNILATKKFNINRIDYSEVVLKYGYDIGIADYTTSRSWKSEYDK
jgi:uncharacterized RDD family membrane protein YckC